MSLEKNKVKLYLGCGPMPIDPQHLEFVDDSWVFIDLFVEDPKIVKMDISELKYENESVDEIYCSHALEHVSQAEVIPTLQEWYRVLKTGGKVTINVPDLKWASRELLKDGENCQSKVYNNDREIMKIFYGSQLHDGEYHKSGFTGDTLSEDMFLTGFKEVKITQFFDNHDMGVLLAKATK